MLCVAWPDFYRTLYLYSILEKEQECDTKNKSAVYQENSITNPGPPAENVVLDSSTPLIMIRNHPHLSFYASRYSTAPALDTFKLSWMPQILLISNPFDLTPITPSIVKKLSKPEKTISAHTTHFMYTCICAHCNNISTASLCAHYTNIPSDFFKLNDITNCAVIQARGVKVP